MKSPGWTREEREAVAAVWRSGRTPSCPCCQAPLEPQRVRDPEAVSYVRRRSWLGCPRCGSAMIADDPRGSS